MRQVLLAVSLIIVVASSALAQSGSAIPRSATIYIEPNEGFETYLTAALQKKKVPLTIVTDREKADFILTSKVERGEKPGLGVAIFLGKRDANEDASISVVNVKTSAVAFAYAVHKYNAAHGQQSTAESVAKNLKNKIESGK